MAKGSRGRRLPSREHDPRPWAEKSISNPSRLGEGADYQEADRRRSIADARNRFLQAVAHVAPEVLRDLADVPLTCLSQRPAGGYFEEFGQYRELTWEDIVDAERSGDPELLPLRDGLCAWADRWHLNTPWCLERAVRRLKDWLIVPPSLENLTWSYAGFVPFEPRGWLGEEVEFTSTLEWWDPRILSREAIRKSVLDEISAQVDAYCDAVEERARQVDMAPTPKMKRQADHFLWTALYQVKGLGWTDIARLIASQAEAEDDEDATTDEAKPKKAKTIKDGVTSVSTLIGLNLRESN